MSTPAAPPSIDEHEKIQVRLQTIAYATQDIQVYQFVRPDGAPLPAFTPGSHVDVHLPNGMTRSYSLLDADIARDRYEIGVKHDPKSRGGSRYMHEQLRVGTTLSLSPPRNHFPLNEDTAHTVLIAGGIGITPILCMAHRLDRIGASWELWYACRSQADVAFLPELMRFGSRVRFHLDEETKTILDIPAIIAGAPADAHFYCCGPSPMLTAYEAAASVRAPETVHLERFGAAPAFTTSGAGFIVQLARSGIELLVPTESTLLEVLTNNGISIDSSCQAGICGCCEVAVLDGEVDHRDEVLTASARASHKSMMACCSRAKSARLVLDL